MELHRMKEDALCRKTRGNLSSRASTSPSPCRRSTIIHKHSPPIQTTYSKDPSVSTHFPMRKKEGKGSSPPRIRSSNVALHPSSIHPTPSFSSTSGASSSGYPLGSLTTSSKGGRYLIVTLLATFSVRGSVGSGSGVVGGGSTGAGRRWRRGGEDGVLPITRTTAAGGGAALRATAAVRGGTAAGDEPASGRSPAPRWRWRDRRDADGAAGVASIGGTDAGGGASTFGVPSVTPLDCPSALRASRSASSSAVQSQTSNWRSSPSSMVSRVILTRV